MNETVKTNYTPYEKERPDFVIYHPNGKGTGCAFRMNLYPAQENRDGCIMVSFANQNSVGDRRAAVPTYPTFDWKNKVSVKLDFSDICKMIQVLRGTSEGLDGEMGLFHRSAKFATKITLKHITEPIEGFEFGVYRAPALKTVSEPEQSARILLTPWEALGIALAFENSIGVVCFGVPKVVKAGAAVAGMAEEPRDVPAA